MKSGATLLPVAEASGPEFVGSEEGRLFLQGTTGNIEVVSDISVREVHHVRHPALRRARVLLFLDEEDEHVHTEGPAFGTQISSRPDNKICVLQTLMTVR